MGSIYAGLLAGAGNDVLAIDPWQAHVDQINSHGLRVEGASGDGIFRVTAATTQSGNPVDILILAVKSAQAGGAMKESIGLVGPQTIILTIQNGLGAAEKVADVAGEPHLAVGIAAAFGASMKGPGHAHHNGMETIKIGAYGSLAADRVEQISQVWRDAGFNVQAVDNVIAMQWEKLICNVAYSAPCALTGLTVGQVMESHELGQISRAAAVEAWEVAKALNIAINVADPVEHIRNFGNKVFNAKPSVLLDHELGRKSEIDYINGAIPREASKVGRSAPVNATLVALIKHKEIQMD